ncbi:Protein POLYCHOME [Forsythia ovata]|uniref:Protein POLYCHOME n=1 Tax=Forsythia ovata TaxID=205694 RepID=A0ABD1SLT6_9LAMI
MPEARDRSLRQEDVAMAYSQRRRSINGVGNARGRNSFILVLDDGHEEERLAGTQFRWRDTDLTGTFPVRVEAAAWNGDGGGVGRGNWGTPRNGRGGNLHSSRAFRLGREYQSPAAESSRGRSGRGGGRGSANVLPSWYPRTPLRDITAIVRAIERRRIGSGVREGQQTESPVLEDQIVHDPSAFTSGARLEHYNSMTSPNPRFAISRCPPSIGKVPKILLNITNQSDGDAGCLTPQKMLLNSIDVVEKVVMQELQKLKRTPAAKRVEREKRVRTIMSMR